MAWYQKRKTKDGKDRIRAVVRVKGYKSVSDTHSNMTKAKKWAERIAAEVEDGRYFKTAEAKKHTLKELIERYEKGRQEKIRSAKQESQIRWWKEHIGHLRLSDVTSAVITECREQLQEEITVRKTQRSAGSVRRHLAALSHILSIALNEYEWMEENPMKKVTSPPEPRGRVRFLSKEDQESLLGICRRSVNPYLYPIVLLALSTGMRKGEIENLRWTNIDLWLKENEGRVILEETKNGERRAVPIMHVALKFLRDWEKKRRIDTTLLFPGSDPSKPIDIRFPWEKALVISGLKDFRFHDLRHTAASNFAASGMSLLEIAAALGHKTIAMVKRYAHLCDSSIAEAVGRSNERFFGEG
ncbi:MAG: site-specific integrase [Chlamydiales bacterium]|nr:site-specific integrase [Chlamydiales bacterium]